MLDQNLEGHTVKAFLHRLQDYMYEAHLKQADVARITKLDPSKISRTLSGSDLPSWERVLVILWACGVSPEEMKRIRFEYDLTDLALQYHLLDEAASKRSETEQHHAP